MKKSVFYFLLIFFLILGGSLVAGLAFGITPCYVFPWFGASERDWCGFKSGPPHFILQFWIGFALTAVLEIYGLYKKKK